MSVTFEITNKIVGSKGEVTSVTFKALKASNNGFYKCFGECSFSPNIKAKTFVPAEKVTTNLLENWVKLNLGEEGLKSIDKSLSDRITKDTKPKKPNKSKE
jgi:ribosomal protein L28